MVLPEYNASLTEVFCSMKRQQKKLFEDTFIIFVNIINVRKLFCSGNFLFSIRVRNSSHRGNAGNNICELLFERTMIMINNMAGHAITSSSLSEMSLDQDN